MAESVSGPFPSLSTCSGGGGRYPTLPWAASHQPGLTDFGEMTTPWALALQSHPTRPSHTAGYLLRPASGGRVLARSGPGKALVFRRQHMSVQTL